jgi:hypothetical protein
MQHIHAGYTPEDAIFHAELDTHAEQVEETPKPAPKRKAKPTTTSSEAPSAPPARKSQKRKGRSGQGELPL